MIPSIEVGDHLLVSNLAYVSELPRRGDLIAFEMPGVEPKQVFLKRVLGLPGDTLSFDDGHAILNGQPLQHCRIGKVDHGPHSQSIFPTMDVHVEFIDDVAYWITYAPDVVAEEGPYQVPDGQLWVVGDNRTSSHDSRVWNDGEGAGVPIELVRGRASALWLPFGRAQWVGELPLESSRLDEEQEQRLTECLEARRPVSP